MYSLVSIKSSFRLSAVRVALKDTSKVAFSEALAKVMATAVRMRQPLAKSILSQLKEILGLLLSNIPKRARLFIMESAGDINNCQNQI